MPTDVGETINGERVNFTIIWEDAVGMLDRLVFDKVEENFPEAIKEINKQPKENRLVFLGRCHTIYKTGRRE